MEVEPADLADAGRNQQVGWIARQACAGDAVLHDVEGIDHHGGDAGPATAAEEFALHGALGREELAEAAPGRLFGEGIGWRRWQIGRASCREGVSSSVV